MKGESTPKGSSSNGRKKFKRGGKRRLTAAEKRARRERKRKYMTVFINGKQKRVPRPVLVEGLTVEEFIERNADPIWLHQNEMWELMPENQVDDWFDCWLDNGDEPLTSGPS